MMGTCVEWKCSVLAEWTRNVKEPMMAISLMISFFLDWTTTVFFMFMVRQVVRQLTEDNLKVVVCGMVFNFKLGHFGK